jgi:hypothetical protein
LPGQSWLLDVLRVAAAVPASSCAFLAAATSTRPVGVSGTHLVSVVVGVRCSGSGTGPQAALADVAACEAKDGHC